MSNHKHAVGLISQAIDMGITLSLKDEKLVLKADKGQSIDQGLLAQIKQHKEEIIAFLQNRQDDLDTEVQHLPKLKAYDRSKYSRLPLSFAQERLWSIDNLTGSTNYHIPYIRHFDASLNVDALKFAVRAVIDRHETLRTVFTESQGVPYQEIMPVDSWDWNYREFSTTIGDETLNNLIAEVVNQPFNLAADFMLRTHLIHLADGSYVLILVSHHIVADGWSKTVLLRELLEFYQAKVEGRKPLLDPMEIQYADYTLWQRDNLKGPFLEKSLSYWSEKLKNVASLELPTDFVRPRIQSKRGDAMSFELDEDLSRLIHHFCKEQGVTLFMFLLAAFKVLLYRYTGQTDICIGSPIANRTQKELEQLIGFFVNTIALRDDLSGNPTFKTFLQEVKQTTLKAFQYQDVPFEKVVDLVVEDRDLSRSPLVQVMFVLQNASYEVNRGKEEMTSTSPSAVSFTSAELGNGYEVSKFDITMNLFEADGKIGFKIKYCADLFKNSTINRLGNHYKEVIKSILLNPLATINELDIMGIVEQGEILEVFNPLETTYPKEKTLVDLFVIQAEQKPENIAIVYKDQSLSYRELHERSNQLAHYLKTLGVKEETLVGICLDRSIDMIVGIMAIMKAGGIYVPMDPDYPADRLEYMIRDSAMAFMITAQSHTSILSQPSLQLVLIDGDWDKISLQATTLPTNELRPDHGLYVIYTSGSTGLPKGVLIEHRNVVRLFKTDAPLFDFNEQDVWTLFHSFCFDFSVWEMYGALLFGGKLVVVPKEVTRDAVAYSDLLQAQGVTILNQTPSSFYGIQEYFTEQYPQTNIRYVIFGGEALAPGRLGAWNAAYPDCKLINMYGITETTVHVTYQEISGQDIAAGLSVIGRPIPTLQCYILNAQMNLVPPGIIGEIYVGGAGLAREYLNRPDLTAERFIQHVIHPNGNLYKTGDLARWLPDGRMEYIGRIDDQVKIRAYRIELGEIISVLEQCPLVQQGVVIAKEDSHGNKRLVAYVIPAGPFDKEEIQRFLVGKLPKFMVPSLIVEMQAFPLTVNGKLDKTALPEPDVSEMTHQDFLAPRNEMEQKVAEIWQELLGLEQVGVQDDFFELGGHSLLATRVSSAIRKEFQVSLGTQDVFMNPTVEELAALIAEQTENDQLPPIEKVSHTAKIPLSYAQERLWFIDQLNGSTAYHIPYVQAFKPSLDWKTLEYALNVIVNRHEALRTVFKEESGVAYQEVLVENCWEMDIQKWRDDEHEKDISALINGEITRPFDLGKDYMIRAKLLDFGENGYLLILVLHHIASDGWSMNILINEVLELYHAKINAKPAKLSPREIQYTDYAYWQQAYLTGDVLEQKLNYWETRLKDLESLSMPLDYTRPNIQSMRGSRIKFNLDPTITQHLHTLCKEQNVTIFMLMLTVFKVLLYRSSGQTDICLGTSVANRNDKDLEGMIGFFVNMIALRSDLSGNPKFTDLLENVKTTTLEGFDHQDTPFEKVVDRIVENRDMSMSPLFQVCFILQNTPSEIGLKEEATDLANQQLPNGAFNFSKAAHQDNYRISKYDLSLHVVETEEAMQLTMEYCVDLFKESTIHRIGNLYRQLLSTIVANPSAGINDLDILPESEKHQLLASFNATEIAYPDTATVTDLFADQVKQTPSAIALVFGTQEMSYQELDIRSTQLAHHLQEKGVNPGDLVGICMDRGGEMIISLLAILKAGAVYVPIDPEYPQDRKQFMIQDAQMSHLLCSNPGFSRLFEEKGLQVIMVDLADELFEKENKLPLAVKITAQAPAYLMYTSGSLGQPKGVMIKHQSIARLLFNEEFSFLSSQTTLYQYAPLAFDASTFEIWGALLKGGKLVIANPGQKSLEDLRTDFENYQINTVWLTAGLFHLAADTLPALFAPIRYLLAGGDSIHLSSVERVMNQHKELTFINGYGPTESTTFAVIRQITDIDTIDKGLNIIGQPIGNTKAYVLAPESDQLLPVGCPGELCLSGPGLAEGYLNQPELSAQKFVANPYGEGAFAQLYRTGDLVRWLEDGSIEFLGRIDNQVKIRGYRIELGEIETILNDSALVRQGLVLAKDSTMGKRLVAYIIPEKGYEKESLLTYLKSKLPEYMMPALFIEMNDFPLTGNGKLDRKALPEPDLSELVTTEYVAPRNEIEAYLAETWENLLGVKQVGIHDNFFELGGHSLLLVRVIAAIRDNLSINIPVTVMFKYPTIADLHKYIRVVKKETEEIREEDLTVIQI